MFSAVSLVLFLIIPVFSVGEFAYCESVPGLELRIVANYHLEGYLTGTDPNFEPSTFCDMNSRISTIRDSDTALYHDPDLNTDLYIIDVEESNLDCLNTLANGNTMTLKGSGFTHDRSGGLDFIDTSTGDCTTSDGTLLMGSGSGYQINVKYYTSEYGNIFKTFVVAKSRGLIGPQAPAAINSVGIDGQRGSPRPSLT